MFKVHSEVQSEMKKVVEAEVKSLEKKTDFQFVGYDRDGGQLPSLEFKSVMDESA